MFELIFIVNFHTRCINVYTNTRTRCLISINSNRNIRFEIFIFPLVRGGRKARKLSFKVLRNQRVNGRRLIHRLILSPSRNYFGSNYETLEFGNSHHLSNVSSGHAPCRQIPGIRKVFRSFGVNFQRPRVTLENPGRCV